MKKSTLALISVLCGFIGSYTVQNITSAEYNELLLLVSCLISGVVVWSLATVRPDVLQRMTAGFGMDIAFGGALALVGGGVALVVLIVANASDSTIAIPGIVLGAVASVLLGFWRSTPEAT